MVQQEAMLLEGGRGREGGVQELERQEEQGRALANGRVTEAAASRELLRGAGISKQEQALRREGWRLGGGRRR
jgi:hypothetical protein